jgi:hypothetical protein
MRKTTKLPPLKPTKGKNRVTVSMPMTSLTFVDRLRVELMSADGVRADRGMVVCCAIKLLQEAKQPQKALREYVSERGSFEKNMSAHRPQRATEVQP